MGLEKLSEERLEQRNGDDKPVGLCKGTLPGAVVIFNAQYSYLSRKTVSCDTIEVFPKCNASLLLPYCHNPENSDFILIIVFYMVN